MANDAFLRPKPVHHGQPYATKDELAKQVDELNETIRQQSNYLVETRRICEAIAEDCKNKINVLTQKVHALEKSGRRAASATARANDNFHDVNELRTVISQIGQILFDEATGIGGELDIEVVAHFVRSSITPRPEDTRQRLKQQITNAFQMWSRKKHGVCPLIKLEKNGAYGPNPEWPV